MKPNLAQQALAGLAVLFVIAATIVGGVLLALADGPLSAETAGGFNPTSSPTETAPPPAPTMTNTSILPVMTALPTATETPVPTATSTPVSCQIAAGWVSYTVQPGDTLYTVGLLYDVTVDGMQAGNCMAGTGLYAGQVIYVPPVAPRYTSTPVTPTPYPTFTPGPSPTLSNTDGSCGNPNSRITWPPVANIISSTTVFYGTAVNTQFAIYRLEVRQEGATGRGDFITVATGESPVVEGILGEIDTTVFANGEYWVRLTVLDTQNNYEEPCSILLTIQN